jgi:hypothetical protein
LQLQESWISTRNIRWLERFYGTTKLAENFLHCKISNASLVPSPSAEFKGRKERRHGAPDRQPTMYPNLKIAWTLIDNFQRNPDLGYKVFSSSNILMPAGPYGITKRHKICNSTVKKFQCFLIPSGSAELEGRNERGHGAPD